MKSGKAIKWLMGTRENAFCFEHAIVLYVKTVDETSKPALLYTTN
jgi:hypothetical protein